MSFLSLFLQQQYSFCDSSGVVTVSKINKNELKTRNNNHMHEVELIEIIHEKIENTPRLSLCRNEHITLLTSFPNIVKFSTNITCEGNQQLLLINNSNGRIKPKN